MSEFVYKYPIQTYDLLSSGGRFVVNLPVGAKVVLAGIQRGAHVLWATVNPEADHQPREFVLRGTGHPIPPNMQHVYSYMQDDGDFIWHLFEPRQNTSEIPPVRERVAVDSGPFYYGEIE